MPRRRASFEPVPMSTFDRLMILGILVGFSIFAGGLILGLAMRYGA